RTYGASVVQPVWPAGGTHARPGAAARGRGAAAALPRLPGLLRWAPVRDAAARAQQPGGELRARDRGQGGVVPAGARGGVRGGWDLTPERGATGAFRPLPGGEGPFRAGGGGAAVRGVRGQRSGCGGPGVRHERGGAGRRGGQGVL